MTKRERHIVAMGGGGFSMADGARAPLDEYVLALTGKDRARVCFVGTATGDSPAYVERFYAAFGGGRADPSHLELFGRPRTDVREFVLSHDVVYVGGGNTANMLAVWRVHGVDAVLREAWERGVVLTGLSAGMICWFEAGVTDSFGPLAALRDGLGLLPGSACPHFDGEPDRRPRYRQLVRDGLPAGIAADDYAAVHYVGRDLHACVASRPGACCYRVHLDAGQLHEDALPTRPLG